MAPSTKRRPKQDDIPESIFDALNAASPGYGDDKTGGQTERKAKADNSPSVEDLMRQLEGANARIDALDRTNLALSTQAPKIVDVPKEPKLNLDNLPDPVDHPQEYAREVMQRGAQYQAQLTDFHAKSNQPATQGGDYELLWQDFKDANKDYATDEDGLEFAVSKVRKNMQRRGVDMDKYMFGNSDRFFRDITKEYDKRFGKPDGEDADEPVEAASRKRVKAQASDDDDGSRTEGIFGGIDGSSSGRTPAKPPVGDMIKDLQDIQRKTGYY